MHIHQFMYGYWNAVWGAPATQADGARGALRANGGGGADGAPVTQRGTEGAAPSGGSPVLQALAQALESLGLSLAGPASATSPAASPPASTTASTSAAGTSGAAAAGTAAAGTAATATSAAAASTPTPPPAPASDADRDHDVSSEERSIAGNVRHLMHALFEDVRAENLLSPSAGASSGGSTPAASFASGLAALISQVQSGSAPANLQRAFDALVANLSQPGTQPAAGAASAATPAVASTTTQAAATTTQAAATTQAPASNAGTATSTQALLVQFLTNLQTDLGLGYGGSAGTPAQSATSAVMVNTVA